MEADEIVSAFRRVRKRHLKLSAAVILTGVVMLVLNVTGMLPTVWALGLWGIVCVAYMVFCIWDFRCPSCRSYLGWVDYGNMLFWPSDHCPCCGIRLR